MTQEKRTTQFSLSGFSSQTRQTSVHTFRRSGGGKGEGEGNAGSGGAKTSLPRVLDLPQKSITHWSCKCSVGCTFLTYLHLFLTIFLNINGGK